MELEKQLIKKVIIPEVFDDCYLYFAQNPTHIPFKIKRIYFITKPKTRLPRGYHAHLKNQQVIFCIQGTITLTLDNGRKRKKVLLNKPNEGVFLEKMVWHEMADFKKNTILLILASGVFDEKDYIRNYEQFKKKVSQVS